MSDIDTQIVEADRLGYIRGVSDAIKENKCERIAIMETATETLINHLRHCASEIDAEGFPHTAEPLFEAATRLEELNAACLLGMAALKRIEEKLDQALTAK